MGLLCLSDRSGQFLQPVNSDHEGTQIGRTALVGQHERDHLFRGHGIVNHLVIILRDGDPVHTDGDSLFCRENRTGHDHNPFLLRGEVSDLLSCLLQIRG